MLTFTKAVGLLLTPPAVVIILALLGLLLQLRWRLLGGALLWVSLLALIVLSSGAVGNALLGILEDGVEPLPLAGAALAERAGAIVVLGGGRHSSAPEYGGETVNKFTLERLRYGARLHRVTGLPLLVTGGAPFGEMTSEAELMQQALLQDLGVSARWVEGRSRTTYENAVYSRAILEAAGIRKVLLVTHASHMPRAAWAFREAGMEPIMAPTGFTNRGSAGSVLAYLPSAHGLALSSSAVHEYVGLWWYRLRHRSPAAEPASAPN
jgi:uncharacterized SAM-binding protein YcdF (DUF218 family)